MIDFIDEMKKILKHSNNLRVIDLKDGSSKLIYYAIRGDNCQEIMYSEMYDLKEFFGPEVINNIKYDTSLTTGYESPTPYIGVAFAIKTDGTYLKWKRNKILKML